MLRRNDTQYSKFWMGDEEFEFDPKRDFDAWDTDTLLRLASFKRAVANFVRIVTGKNIPVIYNTGEQSYTDGKSVVLSAKLEHNQFDTAVGVALHEGSHCAITDSTVHVYMQTYQRILCDMHDKGTPKSEFPTRLQSNYSASLPEVIKYTDMLRHGVDFDLVQSLYTRLLALYGDRWTAQSMLWDMSKLMENWVEDRRIDYFQCSTSPGYKGYYNAMYQSYFYSKLISKGIRAKNYARNETWDAYKFRIINILNADTDLDALKGLREVWGILDLNNISRLTSVLDSWNLGFRILDVVLNHLVVEKKAESKDKKDAQSGEGKSQKSKGEKGKKSEKYDDEEDDSPEPSDDDKSDDGDDSGSEPEDNNKTGDDNYDGSSSSLNKDKDGEKSDEEGADSGKSDASDKSDEDGKGDASDEENLSPAQIAKMKKEEEKQRAFLNGDTPKKKMSKKNATAVKSLEAGGVTLSSVGQGLIDANGKAFKVQCVVVNKVTKELIEGGVFSEMFIEPKSYYANQLDANQCAVEDGFRIGTILGKRLQIRSEVRSTKFNRLETGRIDKKLLASLGYENTRVFFRTMVDKFNPMVMHISVDGSGSMNGKKWIETMTLLVSIIKAASMTSNLEVVVSVRGTTNGTNVNQGIGRRGRRKTRMSKKDNDGYAISARPLIAIVYDSRVDKLSKVMSLFKYIYAGGATPDGLAFEPIIDEMVVGKSGEVESVFVNISDGEPCFGATIHNGDGTTSHFSYGGEMGAKHTAAMVNKMRGMNIKILSYIIGGEYAHGWDDFKMAYGKDSQKIDTRNIGQLARTLNETFLKKSN